MFNNLKKKVEYPAESRWSVMQGENDGKPMIVRRNDSATVLAEHQGFDHRVGFAVPLLAPTDSGLPTREESETLGKIEKELCTQLEQDKNSILVLVITTSGMREFVFYTQAPQLVESVIADVQAKFTTHEIQFYIGQDKKWSVYKQFAK